MSSKKTVKKTTESSKSLLSPARITKIETPQSLEVPIVNSIESYSAKDPDIFLTQEIERRRQIVDYIYLSTDSSPLYVRVVDSTGFVFYLAVDQPSRMILEDGNHRKVVPDKTIPVNMPSKIYSADTLDGTVLETPKGVIISNINSEYYIEGSFDNWVSYPLVNVSRYLRMDQREIKDAYVRLRQNDINRTANNFSQLKKEVQNYLALIDNAIRSRKMAYEVLQKRVSVGANAEQWDNMITVNNLLDDITNFTGKIKQEEINITERLKQIQDVVR